MCVISSRYEYYYGVMMLEKRPIIIAFEGHDGVGKTTQSLLLDARCKSAGFSCERVKMPNNTGAIGTITMKLVSFMTNSGLALNFPNAFNVFHFMNKLSFQKNYLDESTKNVIIFDRWKMSASVYGQAMGASISLNERLSSKLAEPDLSIVLVSRRRRHEGDMLDTNDDLQKSVMSLYTERACHDDRIFIIDSDASIMDVHKKIIDAVTAKTSLNL